MRLTCVGDVPSRLCVRSCVRARSLCVHTAPVCMYSVHCPDGAATINFALSPIRVFQRIDLDICVCARESARRVVEGISFVCFFSLWPLVGLSQSNSHNKRPVLPRAHRWCACVFADLLRFFFSSSCSVRFFHLYLFNLNTISPIEGNVRHGSCLLR